MKHRIPLALLTALLIPAAAHAKPIPLKTIERASLNKAYAYWHHKPCDVAYQWGRLPLAIGTFGDPASCTITLNRRTWTPDILWHLQRDRYRHHRDYLALGAPDPYGVQTWQEFCTDAIAAVGGMTGHVPSADPRSPMFLGTATFLNGEPQYCGTSALVVQHEQLPKDCRRAVRRRGSAEVDHRRVGSRCREYERSAG
jgi:hypothetical protein